MHLEVRERFALRSGNFNLQINVLRISYTIIFYTFLFHFYISCLDQPGIRDTRTQLAWVFSSKT